MTRSIVFEGIPGSGKTTLARWLSEHLRLPLYCEDVLVPEMFQLWRTWRHDDVELFLLNWEVKYQIEQLVGAEGVWDRNHTTALAYNYGKAHMKGDINVFVEVLRWYQRRIRQGRLSEPGCYIILDVPPNVSLQRKAQPSELNCIWTSPAGLAASREFYSYLESFIDLNSHPSSQTRIIRLSSEKPIWDIKRAILRTI